jgi:hypothetical protein
MQNLNVEVKGTIMTLTIDLSKIQGVSKSGKSHIIASTSGNVSVPGHPEVKMGVNIYKSV